MCLGVGGGWERGREGVVVWEKKELKKKKTFHKLFFSKFVRKVVLGMDHHKGN